MQNSASYQKFLLHGEAKWLDFQAKRKARLKQLERAGGGSEKIVENILEDLFTQVLDWKVEDINYQIQYADMLLTSNAIKYLIIEAKRPNALNRNQYNIHNALSQAQRYASEQGVSHIAISDGDLLYAAHLENGGLNERVSILLSEENFPLDLWWLSLHGIYRKREEYHPKLNRVADASVCEEDGEQLLHPKYKLPAVCFAYVGHPASPSSWKLPYLLYGGVPDSKRLPKAIGAIISNYRGVKVEGIPEEAMFDVLKRLAAGAESMGKMPHQNPQTAACYKQLADILKQKN